MAHQVAIHLQNITKRYHAAVAVNQLNLEVPTGAIFGLLGPNGAGKSTTIKMMSGILRPDEGDSSILGISVHENAVAVKRIIGVVPESLALFEYLSISEHLDLVRSLFAIGARDFEERSIQLLRVLDLSADAGKLVRELSHGMKKKTALAMALLPNPRVLILDEPLEGLDPVMVVNTQADPKISCVEGHDRFSDDSFTSNRRRSDHPLRHWVRQGRLVAQGTAAELTAKGISLEEEYLRHLRRCNSRGACMARLRPLVHYAILATRRATSFPRRRR